MVAPHPHPMSMARSPGRGGRGGEPPLPQGLEHAVELLLPRDPTGAGVEVPVVSLRRVRVRHVVDGIGRSAIVDGAEREQAPERHDPEAGDDVRSLDRPGADPAANERHAAREQQEPAQAAGADAGQEGRGRRE